MSKQVKVIRTYIPVKPIIRLMKKFHGKVLPNNLAEAMRIFALSNHKKCHLLSICCSAKHQRNSAFILYLLRSGYVLHVLLQYINAIGKFCIEQAQFIAIVNA